ncbi:MAG: polyphosphate kinase [Candidatus Marinimicrobia bacterium]|nr:polyphosphate kinase [Candidatus Neomarinimicrobiota bacterium]|tara:strand:- start:2167 stop:3000 length:834 start_codon:yes stop_codon:yes gene_type:complete
MIIYNRTSYKELTLKSYQKEKRKLQIELLKLQEWVIESGLRLAIILEGRDAAGKGATIKRFIENLIPKTMRVVELGVPTSTQNRMWFKTYDKLLPKEGEIVFFDRSWYTRGLIQPAMGYCTERQYKYFMKNVNSWEKTHIEKGLLLIKFYLSVSKENQQQRFIFRQKSPLKYWKLSANDLKAAKEWDLFTYYKEQVFSNSISNKNPWVIINSDNKMIARLNAMRYVLSSFEYPGKRALKEKKWSKEIPEYDIEIDGVKFKDLTKEQYELLYRLKGST